MLCEKRGEFNDGSYLLGLLWTIWAADPANHPRNLKLNERTSMRRFVLVNTCRSEL